MENNELTRFNENIYSPVQEFNYTSRVILPDDLKQPDTLDMSDLYYVKFLDKWEYVVEYELTCHDKKIQKFSSPDNPIYIAKCLHRGRRQRMIFRPLAEKQFRFFLIDESIIKE